MQSHTVFSGVKKKDRMHMKKICLRMKNQPWEQTSGTRQCHRCIASSPWQVCCSFCISDRKIYWEPAGVHGALRRLPHFCRALWNFPWSRQALRSCSMRYIKHRFHGTVSNHFWHEKMRELWSKIRQQKIMPGSVRKKTTQSQQAKQRQQCKKYRSVIWILLIRMERKF